MILHVKSKIGLSKCVFFLRGIHPPVEEQINVLPFAGSKHSTHHDEHTMRSLIRMAFQWCFDVFLLLMVTLLVTLDFLRLDTQKKWPSLESFDR